MFCNVVFKCDGSSKVIRHHVDLDYFTIREWRKLYLDFLELKEQNSDKYCKFSVEPVDGIVWR